MSAFLEREHFTVSQEDRYFTLEGLRKMIGQEANQWRHAALKELLDNALDAAESVYPAVMPCLSPCAEDRSGAGRGLTGEVYTQMLIFGCFKLLSKMEPC